jgi:hypothetical protein
MKHRRTAGTANAGSIACTTAAVPPTAGQLVPSERGVCGGPLAFHYAKRMSHTTFRQPLACVSLLYHHQTHQQLLTPNTRRCSLPTSSDTVSSGRGSGELLNVQCCCLVMQNDGPSNKQRLVRSNLYIAHSREHRTPRAGLRRRLAA